MDHDLNKMHGAFLKTLKLNTEKAKHIVITAHVNADMDALGSCFGLKYFLVQ